MLFSVPFRSVKQRGAIIPGSLVAQQHAHTITDGRSLTTVPFINTAFTGVATPLKFLSRDQGAI